MKIIACIAIFLVLAVSVSAKLSLNIEAQDKVSAGSYVNAVFSILDYTATDAKDVVLHYWLADSYGTVVAEKKETIAIEQISNKTVSLLVPEQSIPGNYFFKGEVIYNSGEVISANDIVRVERAGGSPMVIIGFLVLIPLIFIFVVLYVKH